MSRSWKRSDGMSYRDWGRVRKERALVKDWKQQLQEEQEVNSVFIIVNEWTDINNNISSEVTDNKWFESEDSAWEALDLVAQAYNVELDHDDTSILLEDHDPHLQFEEYRIEELTKG